jgi:threonine/homoserine/homoserine lactone efflux protein
MTDLRPLATIAALNLAAAVSPGPAFALVTRTAAVSTRRSAFRVAAGTVTASVIWAAAALLGLQAVLAEASGLYRGIQLVGGLYLGALGIAMWRAASSPVAMTPAPDDGHGRGAFGRGLLLGLSNPKVVVFFGTIFTTVLAPSTPAAVKWAALLVVFCNESLWYGGLALTFGSPPVRRVYRRIKAVLERTFGLIMMLFGAKLLGDGGR